MNTLAAAVGKGVQSPTILKVTIARQEHNSLDIWVKRVQDHLHADGDIGASLHFGDTLARAADGAAAVFCRDRAHAADCSLLAHAGLHFHLTSLPGLQLCFVRTCLRPFLWCGEEVPLTVHKRHVEVVLKLVEQLWDSAYVYAFHARTRTCTSTHARTHTNTHTHISIAPYRYIWMRPHRRFTDMLTEEVPVRRVLKMAVIDYKCRLAPLACVPLLELVPVDGPGPVLIHLRENGLRAGPRVHSAAQSHGGRRNNCRGSGPPA